MNAVPNSNAKATRGLCEKLSALCVEQIFNAEFAEEDAKVAEKRAKWTRNKL